MVKSFPVRKIWFGLNGKGFQNGHKLALSANQIEILIFWEYLFENRPKWFSMNSKTDSNLASFSSKVAGSWAPDFEANPSLGRRETIIASQSVPWKYLYEYVTEKFSVRMFKQSSTDRLWPWFWIQDSWIEMLNYTLIPVEQRIYFCSFLWIWRIKWRPRRILISKILIKAFIYSLICSCILCIWKRPWRIARDSQIDKFLSTSVGTQWAGLYFKNSG